MYFIDKSHFSIEFVLWKPATEDMPEGYYAYVRKTDEPAGEVYEIHIASQINMKWIDPTVEGTTDV